MLLKLPQNRLLYIVALLLAVSLAAMACGVESGDRRSARATPISEFHRTIVAPFEQFRVDLDIDDEGNCTADPADVEATQGQRIRLAVQLAGEGVAQGATGSIVRTGEGERGSVNYAIPGLEITASSGALGAGMSEIDLTLSAGTRNSYDFNVANTGTFDIMCEGQQVGTFTAAETGL